MRKRSRDLLNARRELARTLFLLDRIALHGLLDPETCREGVICAARDLAQLVLSDGDAVWDMGLAHPDLWAGVIPIVATSDASLSTFQHIAPTCGGM